MPAFPVRSPVSSTALLRAVAGGIRRLRCGVAAGLLIGAAGLAVGQSLTGTPPASSTPSSAGSSGLVGPATSLGSRPGAQAELLPPDEAFRIEVRAVDAQTVIARLSPARDYYLYRDRIHFGIEPPGGVSVAATALPKGEPKDDPTFGSVEVYHQPVEATITLAGLPPGQRSVALTASFQGCNDPVGVCYPPIEKVLTVALPEAGATPAQATPSAAPSITAAPRTDGIADLDENGRIGALFAGGNRWALVAAFFGFGILLAFTPCMLPMIPILSGIIVGQGGAITKRHALGLSATYVLAMAITYAAAGVAAGLAGTMLSAWLQNPWALGAFAAIFVLLALSMFDVYELQMPAALQTRLAGASNRVRGGRTIGAFAMGVLSAVIVGPCVAAPLAGALLYIGQTRDVLLGGTALFAMAIGMGVPLMVVGATAGSLLPRTGPWMTSVKRVFGVTMLAVAIWMISPVVPLVVQQLLWAALLIVPAIFLHALDPLPTDAPGHRRLFKGVGVIALLVGAALMVGALSGSRELLQPLSGLRAASAATAGRELPFEPVGSVAELERRVQAAQGRPVMLDFWAEWCVSCKEMEHFTFTDARVQARLKDMVLLRADVTANHADHQALLARFSLFGPPGIIFFDKSGQPLPLRVIGYQAPERFLASLDRVSTLMQAP